MYLKMSSRGLITDNVISSAFVWLLTFEPKRSEARETKNVLTTASVVIFAAQMIATVSTQEFPAEASESAHTKAVVFFAWWTRFQAVWIIFLSINSTVSVGIPRIRPSRL